MRQIIAKTIAFAALIILFAGGCGHSKMFVRGHNNTVRSRTCDNGGFCVDRIESSPRLDYLGTHVGLVLEKVGCETIPDIMCRRYSAGARITVFNNSQKTALFGRGLDIIDMSYSDLPPMLAVYGVEYESGESSVWYLFSADPFNTYRAMLPNQEPPHDECERVIKWDDLKKTAPLTSSNGADARVVPVDFFGQPICFQL